MCNMVEAASKHLLHSNNELSEVDYCDDDCSGNGYHYVSLFSSVIIPSHQRQKITHTTMIHHGAV
jgi:hypothetical protein